MQEYYAVTDKQKYKTVTDPVALAKANTEYWKTHKQPSGGGYSSIARLYVPDGTPAVHYYKTIDSPLWKDAPMPKFDVNKALDLPPAKSQP